MLLFTNSEIEELHDFTDNTYSDSIIGSKILGSFWKSIAVALDGITSPNVISLAGLSFQCTSFILTFVFSQGLLKNIPPWVCIVNGCCMLFSYFASHIDGALSRINGTATPLGYFIDRGMGSLQIFIITLTLAGSFHLGDKSNTFFFAFMSELDHCFSNWEEYITRRKYQWYISLLNEGIICVIVLHIMAGLDTSTQKIRNYRWVENTFLFIVGLSIIVSIFRSTTCGVPFKHIALSLINIIVTSLVILSNFFVANQNDYINVFFILNSGLIMQLCAKVYTFTTLTNRSPKKTIHFAYYTLIGANLTPLFIKYIRKNYTAWLTFFIFSALSTILFDLLVCIDLASQLNISFFKTAPYGSQVSFSPNNDDNIVLEYTSSDTEIEKNENIIEF